MFCRKQNTERAAQKMPSETTTACVRLLVFFIIRRGTFPYGVEDDASTISLTPTTHYINTCVKLTIVTHLSFSERIAIAYLSYGFLKIRNLHFFCSVQMLIVSKNHGYKWFAVMVFTLSRLEHGWFRRNSVCCGPVYGPSLSLRFGYGVVYDSRLCLRVGFGPVCSQHLSSRTATSPMPSTLGMHSPLRTNSSIFLHPPSPQQPPLVPIAHPRGIGCVFLAAQQ